MQHIQKISEVMSSNLFTVDIEDTLHKAVEFMKVENIRHIPVLEGKKFVGVLNERKVKEYIIRKIYEPEQNYGQNGFNRISDFENIIDKVEHYVYPEDSLAKAVKLCTKYKLNCIPVVDWDFNLLGIITHTDLLLSFNHLLESMTNETIEKN